jgi:hypothetical protein
MIEKKSTTAETVIAIAREDNRFKAACISQRAGQVEIVWTRDSQTGQEDWASFAEQCGLSGEQRQSAFAHNGSVIVGFDSLGVVFYHFELPAVRQDEIAKIIRLQTEVKLPLPADQVEFSYRASALHNGHIPVIVAAARRRNLQSFVDSVKKVSPSKIILDYEAIVKIWSGFFGQSEKNAVVVSIGAASTKVCLVESGSLSNAATVDMGFDDLRTKSGEASPMVMERFVQDVRNFLDLFGVAQSANLPVYFFSCASGEAAEPNDDSSTVKTIVSLMARGGLNAKVADFSGRLSNRFSSNDNRQLYDYRVPIGLALTAIDEDETLGLFDSIYRPAGEKQKKPFLSSLRAVLAAAGLMLAGAIFLLYLLDVATASRLDAFKEKMNYDTLVEKQRLTEIIAGLRPDMLELLSVLNSVNVNGVVMDGFDFKKGQPVKITGTVPNADQLYQFQERLSEKRDIKDVKIQSAPEDEKTRRLKFTITFNYKNWTVKKTTG